MMLLGATLTVIIAVLIGWAQIRRAQFRLRKPNPWPPPMAAIRDGIRLLCDRNHPRRLIVTAVCVCLGVAATAVFGAHGAVAALLLFVCWFVVGTFRMFRVRAAWKERLFTVASTALDFPEHASPGRWVFIHKWSRNHFDPGVTVLRCPPGVEPSTPGRKERLAHALNEDPVLHSKFQWGVKWAKQSNRPDQWQANCFPNHLDTAATNGDVSGMVLEAAQVDRQQDNAEAESRDVRGRVIRGIGAGLRLGLPMVVPAAVIVAVVNATPPAVGVWVQAHVVVPMLLACIAVGWVAWNVIRRFVLEPLRDVAYRTSGQHARQFYGLIFFEDYWYLRILWIAGLAGAVWVAVREPTELWEWGHIGAAAAPFGVWAVVTLLRYRGVAAARARVLDTMYDIAASTLAYDRYFKRRRQGGRKGGRRRLERPVGPWNRVTISRWEQVARPAGETRVALPTRFSSTNKQATDRFRDEWNQKAFPEGDGQPGLQWDITMEFKDKAILCMPYIPVNPTDVRIGQTIPKDWDAFLVGQGTRAGNWITASLRSSPHVLVSGETGGGKSAHMEAWAYQACLKGCWDVVITDAGGAGGWARWEGRPGVIPAVAEGENACEVALTFQEIAASWHETRAEIDIRKELIRSHKVSSWLALPAELRPRPRLILADEWLTMCLTADGQAAEANSIALAQQTMADWGYAILEGRKIGVHVETGMQRPDNKVLGGMYRDNIGIRISCGAMTRQGLDMLFGAGYMPPIEFSGEDEDDIRRRNKDMVTGRILVKPGSRNSVFTAQGPWFGGDATNSEDLERFLPVDGEEPTTPDTTTPRTQPQPRDILDFGVDPNDPPPPDDEDDEDEDEDEEDDGSPVMVNGEDAAVHDDDILTVPEHILHEPAADVSTPPWDTDDDDPPPPLDDDPPPPLDDPPLDDPPLDDRGAPAAPKSTNII